MLLSFSYSHSLWSGLYKRRRTFLVSRDFLTFHQAVWWLISIFSSVLGLTGTHDPHNLCNQTHVDSSWYFSLNIWQWQVRDNHSFWELTQMRNTFSIVKVPPFHTQMCLLKLNVSTPNFVIFFWLKHVYSFGNIFRLYMLETIPHLGNISHLDTVTWCFKNNVENEKNF
jgi:hypothetical protein